MRWDAGPMNVTMEEGRGSTRCDVQVKAGARREYMPGATAGWSELRLSGESRTQEYKI